MSDVFYYCRQIPNAILPLRVYGLHWFLWRTIRLPAGEYAQEKGRAPQRQTAVRRLIKTEREFTRRAVNRA